MKRQYVPLAALAAILAFTAWVFWPVAGFGWVNYFDDHDFITGNPGINGGLTAESLRYIVSDQAYYATGGPLTWLSHLIDIELYGMTPAGHHVTGLLLHLVNVVLLFLLLERLTGAWKTSAVVTALFAIHPLHVESVAWISARKDVLSTAFWFAALLAYHAWVTEGRRASYAAALLFCAAGLLSKPIVAMLPLTMLALDVWPLRRFDPGGNKTRVLVEKIPFVMLGAAALGLVFQSQIGRGAIAALEPAPFVLRASNAIVSYSEYLLRMLWPVGLAAFYPYRWTVPAATLALAAIVLISISVAAIVLRRRQPSLLAGWLWYLGTLLPVIGFVRIGGHALADRLTYVPLVGVFIAVVWAAAAALRRWRLPDAAVAPVVIALVAGLGVLARAQVWTWKDDETLWRHALEVTTDNARAHANLAALLTEQNRVPEALPHFAEALRLGGNEPKAHNNFGLALLRTGDHAGARREFQESVRLDPNYGRAQANLADSLAAEGRFTEAFDHYRRAIDAETRSGLPRMNMAVTLAEVGRLDEAAAMAATALQMEPARADWRFTRAMMLKALGRRAEAIQELEEVLKRQPAHAEARRERDALK